MDDVVVNQTVAAGASVAADDGSLLMHDTTVTQDDCQGALLTLHLSSN
jgi:hypothetical protein